MLALGEAPSDTESAHLGGCPRCTAELDALRRAVGAARSATPGDAPLATPPDEVWAGISAELGLTFDGPEPVAPSMAGEQERHSRHEQYDWHSRHEQYDRHSQSDQHSETARRIRRPLTRAAVALAACAALLGAAAGSGATWWLSDHDRPAVAGPAEPLKPLIPAAVGSVRLGDTAGHRKLDITVHGLPKTSGYFEVWLMDRNHKKLISMGVLGPDGHAVLPVPDNVDLSDYTVVDVSAQAYNGSPAHSGRSIVRGPYSG